MSASVFGTWNVYGGAFFSGAYMYVRADVDDQGYFEIEGARLANKPFRGRLLYRIRVKPKVREYWAYGYHPPEYWKAIWGETDAA